jgi:hypothetical protein
MKLDLADDRARFVKEHSMSSAMNVIVTDDGHMHFFDDEGNDITKSVKSIGEYAFDWCTSLTNVIIPCSVTSIKEFTFNNCRSLTSIVIPDSVKNIEEYAFSWCTSLTNVIIPDSVTSIKEFTFNNCRSLTSIVIPDSVKNIEYRAFYGCTSLKNIVFKGKNLDEVKSMDYYPWKVEDESVFTVL